MTVISTALVLVLGQEALYAGTHVSKAPKNDNKFSFSRERRQQSGLNASSYNIPGIVAIFWQMQNES